MSSIIFENMKVGDHMPSAKPVLKTNVDEKTYEKMKIIAENETRTLSKQIEYFIKKGIAQYEKENGNVI